MRTLLPDPSRCDQSLACVRCPGPLPGHDDAEVAATVWLGASRELWGAEGAQTQSPAPGSLPWLASSCRWRQMLPREVVQGSRGAHGLCPCTELSPALHRPHPLLRDGSRPQVPVGPRRKAQSLRKVGFGKEPRSCPRVGACALQPVLGLQQDGAMHSWLSLHICTNICGGARRQGQCLCPTADTCTAQVCAGLGALGSARPHQKLQPAIGRKRKLLAAGWLKPQSRSCRAPRGVGCGVWRWWQH